MKPPFTLHHHPLRPRKSKKKSLKIEDETLRERERKRDACELKSRAVSSNFGASSSSSSSSGTVLSPESHFQRAENSVGFALKLLRRSKSLAPSAAHFEEQNHVLSCRIFLSISAYKCSFSCKMEQKLSRVCFKTRERCKLSLLLAVHSEERGSVDFLRDGMCCY